MALFERFKSLGSAQGSRSVRTASPLSPLFQSPSGQQSEANKPSRPLYGVIMPKGINSSRNWGRSISQRKI